MTLGLRRHSYVQATLHAYLAPAELHQVARTAVKARDLAIEPSATLSALPLELFELICHT